ncbi:TIGR03960 family B12-binding radical SAM protein [Tindallia californiensis]|uniref:Radical SAM family uncharacterized protein n=1 Tax=Tindallia californiensis TaxID=159292 RepID=A0A1H3NBV4_9FIRM|nr:TIGR03960 family B12-binding radical SAM protein [Tindallia californiensis]SDY86441.1 radical SAM family uncharacterized protein [Tindallia californiensis]
MNLEKLLKKVEKPAQYLGNEFNSVKKEVTKDTLRFAWCFPDLYEIGMSHLGSMIMYHLINEKTEVYCERFYMPAEDMSKQLFDNHLKLFSLETKSMMKEFDLAGFTLQYELSYTNILHMLKLSDIPYLSSDRTEEDPIIMMGGPCAYNPEPIARIADIIVIGEAEEVILDILKTYKNCRNKKKDFLEEVAMVEGVYVPSFYYTETQKENSLLTPVPIHSGVPPKITKRFIKDLDKAYYPQKPLMPHMKTVHDRATIELFRGCIRGCRFCQAGMVYRPVREKSKEKLIGDTNTIIKNTGYEELSLTSLSTSDYSHLNELADELMHDLEKDKIGFSLPSLRLDNMTLEILKQVQRVRKSGLTFAPEAGSQRLRDVINKGIEEEDLIYAVRQAYEAGWSQVKLYFMIGLPTETMKDVEAIFDLVSKLDHEVYHKRKPEHKHPLRISVSVSNFVPKPFTPFQWVAQDSREKLKEKHQFLKEKFKCKKTVQFNYHDSETSFLEGVFARGDRRLSEVLIKAYEKGCRFDGWMEHFDFSKWVQAFEETGIDPEKYTQGIEGFEQALPWDHIDPLISKDFLMKEFERAKVAKKTPHCREQCTACGLHTVEGGGVCP